MDSVAVLLVESNTPSAPKNVLAPKESTLFSIGRDPWRPATVFAPMSITKLTSLAELCAVRRRANVVFCRSTKIEFDDRTSAGPTATIIPFEGCWGKAETSDKVTFWSEVNAPAGTVTLLSLGSTVVLPSAAVMV